MSSAAKHQDWFMMTGDLIINLTNTKSGDMSYHKRNMRLKSTPNLIHSSRLQKQCNSEPNSPSDADQWCPLNGDNSGHRLDEKALNHRNNGFEHKETQTQHLQSDDSSDHKDSTNSGDWSPDNDHHFINDDEEELLSHSTSNKSSPDDSQSLTISSAAISPTKTLTTMNTMNEQTESSMSENYSLISSLSCQTIDQNRKKSSFKKHNNQSMSLSSSLSDDSTTPSTSPEDQVLRNNFDDFSPSYNELKSVNDLNAMNDVMDTKSNKIPNRVSVPKGPQLIDNRLNGVSTQTQPMNGSDEESSDTESHYSPPKGVDTPSAVRLAKRLYHLEGFKKSDVSRHLSKNNEFSRVVAEEYLKYFDFTDDTLDLALRKFLSRFCLIGETQERERVLVHFSKRVYDYNPTGSFKSNDAIHTLTCALMLLNTDLHGENVGRKMTCNEFVHNLSGMNDGYDFPREVLRLLYQAIKDTPLEWNSDESHESHDTIDGRNAMELMAANLSQQISIIGHNPFLEVPNPNCATEYKKAPVGKRGWKMFYATLRDLILYLHKDEQGFRKNQLYESLTHSIRVHHALASNATDYTKKQFVFRLLTADHSEYLFQTSDSRELQTWIDTINTVSASLSSPPLPEAVSSSKKFQRPLLPVSHTKYNLSQQLLDHEKRVERLETQLDQHLSKALQRKASKRQMNEFAEKESYLQYELKRYRVYVSSLQWKLSQLNLLNTLNSTPILSSSAAQPLLSVAIGEETGDDSNDTPVITTVKKSYSTDRYSYKQAIYNNNSKHIKY
ncbi:unnamed protein product [Oppiella nova]|uniref:Uncharacterized protein n=1 Tax=Oppiella nova TaxID=334625 RepID=A0A7R9QN83_9ACAR|nr:unnamed protein product [Oppiella nova]CAG2168940.1 unnamed protein product [Oppiella nova]